MLNQYLIKDLKYSEVYAYNFGEKYNNLKDVELTKADLVFDSCILSDFQVLGPDFFSTALLQCLLNGISLLPCTFIYAMLMNEFAFSDIA